MKITNNVPVDWKDLQDKVCKLLNEAGFPSESPKEINTVRGLVEVDVFSTTNNELFKHFICECKNWNSAIPKEKVHAFRTVVNDTGSMLGIFISKKGYQSGAYEAAYCTNVVLKDWNGFIKLVEKEWLKKQLPRIKQLAHPLSIYTDFLDVPFEKLNSHDIEIYKKLNEKNIGLYLTCRTIAMDSLNKEYIVVDGKYFTAYDELFKYFEDIIPIRIHEYEQLFKDNPVEKWKLEEWKHMLIECNYDAQSY